MPIYLLFLICSKNLSKWYYSNSHTGKVRAFLGFREQGTGKSEQVWRYGGMEGIE